MVSDDEDFFMSEFLKCMGIVLGVFVWLFFVFVFFMKFIVRMFGKGVFF